MGITVDKGKTAGQKKSQNFEKFFIFGIGLEEVYQRTEYKTKPNAIAIEYLKFPEAWHMSLNKRPAMHRYIFRFQLANNRRLIESLPPPW